MEDVGTQGHDQRAYTYLVGIGVAHSIAPIMHDSVASGLGYRWKFIAQECPTIDVVLQLFRQPFFAGGVVTMPYKIEIMKHLSGLDEHARLLGACNNVYRAANGTLRGTNTDWRGIKGCLESGTISGTGSEGRGKPALLIGAGGASRAAIYVLHQVLGCRPIYVANRDKEEVQTLFKDSEVYGSEIQLVHAESFEQMTSLTSTDGFPYFVVGTVPDFEAKSHAEIEVRKILEHCLARCPEKGVLLDMCFKPRRTRTIKLAESYAWKTVDGTGVIGHQIEEQYRLWCGVADTTPVTSRIKEQAWQVLNRAAENSKTINF